MVGLMILQQLNDLTDKEAVRQFAFNLEWHYALDIKGDSDTETYVSDRTLWMMRQLLSEKGLADELFAKVTEKLVAVFKVDASRQRLDSTHIFSNMRHLGRIGLFAAKIKKFLVNLKAGEPRNLRRPGHHALRALPEKERRGLCAGQTLGVGANPAGVR